MCVKEHITVWRSFIIQTSTKLSFAHHTLKRAKSVIIKSIVHSHTLKANCPWSWSRHTKLTWTSTCSISKLFGVHIEKMIMIVRFVYMHIIGKTIAASQVCFSILNKCVLAGKQIILYYTMRMAVGNSIIVIILTVGKSKNIILTSLKHVNASTRPSARRVTVHIGTARRIKKICWTTSLDTFQRHAQHAFLLTSTSQHTEKITRQKWRTNRPHSRGWVPRYCVIKSIWWALKKPPLNSTLRIWIKRVNNNNSNNN